MDSCQGSRQGHQWPTDFRIAKVRRSFSFLICLIFQREGTVSFLCFYDIIHTLGVPPSRFTPFWFRLLPLFCKTSKLWHIWGLAPQSQFSHILPLSPDNFPRVHGFKYYVNCDPWICTYDPDLSQKLQSSHVSNIPPSISIVYWAP